MDYFSRFIKCQLREIWAVNRLCSFIQNFNNFFPRVLSPFRCGGIVYLNDPDSYADWGFYTPDRSTQVRQFEI